MTYEEWRETIWIPKFMANKELRHPDETVYAFEAGKELGDRAAREECAAICDQIASEHGFYGYAARQSANEIRETITPASRQDDAQSAE
jgi:hypothetical protein